MTTFKLTPSVFIFMLILAPIPNIGIADDIGSSSNKQPLVFGLLPYLSTHRLIETYKPIKYYLEKKIKRPIKLVTAPDFETYIQRTLKQEYDIYLTAPHFAAYAESQSGHRRLSRYTRMLDGSVIVKKTSPINTISDLKGKVLATPDSLAVITMLGEILVRENGMLPGTDITLSHAGPHSNAIMSVIRGKADAAVISASIFEKQTVRIKSKLRILAKTKQLPHAMFMASPSISEEDYRAIKKALLSFTADGSAKVFFNQTKLNNMATISDKNMDSLLPFVEILKTRFQ